MSSTNRGYDRHKSDYYVTPVKAINKFLKVFEVTECIDWKNHVVLDPCAGGDENHDMSYPKALIERGLTAPRLCTIDIREDSKAMMIGNYLEYELSKGLKDILTMIITNPPFNQAEKIIEKALNDINEGGYVVMLLRLNYFGSKKRNKWLLNNMPKCCYIHSKRMSFTENGSTDSIEYAHFVWRKGWHNNFTETYLLEY